MLCSQEKDKSIRNFIMKETSISLKLPWNVHRDTIVQLFLDVLFFLLYQTQQIPEPVQLLKRNHDGIALKNGIHGKTRNRQQASVTKRVSSFLQQAEEFERSLSEIFTSNYIPEIHIVIGGTPVSPKEVYSVDFSDFKLGYSSVVVSQRTSVTCSRDLCGNLMHLDELYHRTQTPTNTYIMVRTRKLIKSKGWKPWLNYKFSSQKLRLKLNIHTEAEKKRTGLGKDKENFQISQEDSIQRKDSREEPVQATNATCNGFKRLSKSFSDSKLNQSTAKHFVSKFKGDSKGQRENLTRKKIDSRACDSAKMEGSSVKDVPRSRSRRLSVEEALEIILGSNNDSDASSDEPDDLLSCEPQPLTQDIALVCISSHNEINSSICDVKDSEIISGKIVSPSKEVATSSDLEEDQKLIWFMSPVVLKGFKY